MVPKTPCFFVQYNTDHSLTHRLKVMNYVLAALMVLVLVMVILAYRHQAWMKKHCVCDSGKHGGKHGSGKKPAVPTPL